MEKWHPVDMVSSSSQGSLRDKRNNNNRPRDLEGLTEPEIALKNGSLRNAMLM